MEEEPDQCRSRCSNSYAASATARAAVTCNSSKLDLITASKANNASRIQRKPVLINSGPHQSSGVRSFQDLFPHVEEQTQHNTIQNIRKSKRPHKLHNQASNMTFYLNITL